MPRRPSAPAAPPPPPPRWLDVPGAASYANVSESQIRRWIRARILPISKPSGDRSGRVRIDTADLDALMRASRIEAPAAFRRSCSRRSATSHTPGSARSTTPERGIG